MHNYGEEPGNELRNNIANQGRVIQIGNPAENFVDRWGEAWERIPL